MLSLFTNYSDKEIKAAVWNRAIPLPGHELPRPVEEAMATLGKIKPAERATAAKQLYVDKMNGIYPVGLMAIREQYKSVHCTEYALFQNRMAEERLKISLFPPKEVATTPIPLPKKVERVAVPSTATLELTELKALLTDMDSKDDVCLMGVQDWLKTASSKKVEEALEELEIILEDPISFELLSDHPKLTNDTHSYNESTLTRLIGKKSPHNSTLTLAVVKEPHTLLEKVVAWLLEAKRLHNVE